MLVTIYYLALVAEHGITNPITEKHCKYRVLGSRGEAKCYLVG